MAVRAANKSWLRSFASSDCDDVEFTRQSYAGAKRRVCAKSREHRCVAWRYIVEIEIGFSHSASLLI